MKIPNYKNAIIDENKIKEYILSDTHPVGRFKATYFHKLGYSNENWKDFEKDLRNQHLISDYSDYEEIEFGIKYKISKELKGPNGISDKITSIWIILKDESIPRFITAFPGGK